MLIFSAFSPFFKAISHLKVKISLKLDIDLFTEWPAIWKPHTPPCATCYLHVTLTNHRVAEPAERRNVCAVMHIHVVQIAGMLALVKYSAHPVK